ncbi:3-phosphoshikimate 1-carboxyvinyltransferase [Candidatus Oleimmundimicrobium sp.]|uniref:3-phosphoshikimate 1-carboxyvinyltransferase n=1 Tax=Candidatus Oleimmundimicrobium sp. TaxID=3060597 RepID=UPI002726BE2C|nr:3-phosphoshikimate 1-carboxyvinyltransferase [Candidatus Oleimmundimicrobium sp.]MDO8885300.1 3-phosphoshikimate 1-carboxyvinyltransferase [Candidatus Oleimmundimicrobium sp.]
MDLMINKASALSGKARVPGDKSISHRALILGAIAEGETHISGFLPSVDCLSTLNCLLLLGVKIERLSSTELVIKGVGLRGLKEAKNVLDLGNSGTTMRIMSGMLAGQNFSSTLTGDDSLKRRPMGRVIKPLRLMGANICAEDEGDRAPIKITGQPLKGIIYKTPVPSAQVKSCVLLAGLLANGKTCVIEEIKSRDHTERLLKHMGVDIEISGNEVCVRGGSRPKAVKIEIPGDFSSASFLIVAAILTEKSDIIIKDVGINATRTGLLSVLTEMGANINILNEKTIYEEPRADIWVKSSKLKALTVGGELIPRLVDELPIFAVAATQASGTTIVKDAKELRIKETDRIRAICSELRKLGAEIDEFEDGFAIHGPCKLKGNICSSFGDHRMAMALAVAGMCAEGATIIKDSECIEVSFPGFEEILKSLVKGKNT